RGAADLGGRAWIEQRAVAIPAERIDRHPWIRLTTAGRSPAIVGAVVELALDRVDVREPLEDAIADRRRVGHVRRPRRGRGARRSIGTALVFVAGLVPPQVLGAAR